MKTILFTLFSLAAPPAHAASVDATFENEQILFLNQAADQNPAVIQVDQNSDDDKEFLGRIENSETKQSIKIYCTVGTKEKCSDRSRPELPSA